MEERTFQRIKEVNRITKERSGFERMFALIWKVSNRNRLVDELQLDGLGGIFGLRHHEEADAPRVMVASTYG